MSLSENKSVLCAWVSCLPLSEKTSDSRIKASFLMWELSPCYLWVHLHKYALPHSLTCSKCTSLVLHYSHWAKHFSREQFCYFPLLDDHPCCLLFQLRCTKISEKQDSQEEKGSKDRKSLQKQFLNSMKLHREDRVHKWTSSIQAFWQEALGTE